MAFVRIPWGSKIWREQTMSHRSVGVGPGGELGQSTIVWLDWAEQGGHYSVSNLNEFALAVLVTVTGCDLAFPGTQLVVSCCLPLLEFPLPQLLFFSPKFIRRHVDNSVLADEVGLVEYRLGVLGSPSSRRQRNHLYWCIRAERKKVIEKLYLIPPEIQLEHPRV